MDKHDVRLAASLLLGAAPLVLYAVAVLVGPPHAFCLGAGLIAGVGCYTCPAWYC